MKTFKNFMIVMGLFFVFVVMVFSESEKQDAQPQKAEVQKKENKESKEELRYEMIEKQFSHWDGSHVNLERKIKDSMNDPDSFNHVETRYVDEGNHLIVYMKYRGKNKFGGVVTEIVKAKVNLKGTVLEIMAKETI